MRQFPGGPPKRPYDVTAHTLPLLMGIEAEALDVEPDVELGDPIGVHAVDYALPEALAGDGAPRVGMYKGHQEPMAAGWTRWMLDRHGMRYDSLHDARIRSGSLGDDYDVLIFQSQSDRSISEGNPPGTVDDDRVQVLGPERPAGRPALLRARVGRGEVILFGFQPNYRGQSIVTWPLFFNAVSGGRLIG